MQTKIILFFSVLNFKKKNERRMLCEGAADEMEPLFLSFFLCVSDNLQYCYYYCM